MKKNSFFILSVLLAGLLTLPSSWAVQKPKKEKKKPDTMTYFSCNVHEPVRKGKGTVSVTVRFAVKNLDYNEGELVDYPGVQEDMGAISVTPSEVKSGKDTVATMMSNLNGQGGDLRVEGEQVRLWGDGDGIEFTDLVIWDAQNDNENLEGYVRDYGDDYGEGDETFKQFIKCKKQSKPF